MDPADARVSTYMAVSIDGGQRFSPQVAVNRPSRVIDTITNTRIDTEPIPSDLRSVGTDGFGNNQAVVAFGGHNSGFAGDYAARSLERLAE